MLPPLCGNDTKGSLKTKRQLLQSRCWIRRDPLLARLFANLSDNFQVSRKIVKNLKSLRLLRNNPHFRKVRRARTRPYPCAINAESMFKLYKTGDLPRRSSELWLGGWRTRGQAASITTRRDALPPCPFAIKALRLAFAATIFLQMIKVYACKKRRETTPAVKNEARLSQNEPLWNNFT